MVPTGKEIIRIRYPMDFSMAYEDSTIPIIGKAILIEDKPVMVVGSGMTVVMDARMKKFLFAIQGRVEVLELWGWLSLQRQSNSTNKYFVFHVCNTKLLDLMYRGVTV